MSSRLLKLFLVGVFTATSIAARGQSIRKLDGTRNEVSEAGISFVYDAGDFGKIEVMNEKRLTAQDVGDGVPEGIAPSHLCFNLEDKRPLPALDKGSRYFFPAGSFICFIPLKDSSVVKYAEAYPILSQDTALLRKLLRTRPAQFGRRNKYGVWNDIPDEPLIEASKVVRSKPTYLDALALSGILFLTQYSQEPDWARVNNEELAYKFQGLTKDGKYYVSAEFAVIHYSLPKGIDFYEPKRDKRRIGLRGDEKKLNHLPNGSFQPSLTKLRMLLASISIK